jgi:hypothetical protein
MSDAKGKTAAAAASSERIRTLLEAADRQVARLAAAVRGREHSSARREPQALGARVPEQREVRVRRDGACRIRARRDAATRVRRTSQPERTRPGGARDAQRARESPTGSTSPSHGSSPKRATWPSAPTCTALISKAHRSRTPGLAYGENLADPIGNARVTVAWFDEIARRPDVDDARIAAVGFCYGGMTVLELARSGANLTAAVSYHGILTTHAQAEPGHHPGARGRVLRRQMIRTHRSRRSMAFATSCSARA